MGTGGNPSVPFLFLFDMSDLRRQVFEDVYKVYDIFENFFGEEHVDLQIPSGPTDERLESLATYHSIDQIRNHFNYVRARIYIWWPKVQVTNENGKSVIITDLYAQVVIAIDGKIPFEYPGFKLNRSSYPAIQLASNYMHSHVCDIPISNFTIFQEVCMGRGPIRDTITQLRSENDETTWMLFCQELSYYVQVESLAGIPYHQLESIGIGKRYLEYSNAWYLNYLCALYGMRSCKQAYHDMFNEFMKYYARHNHLNFNYVNRTFVLGTHLADFHIDISNAFINFFNDNIDRWPSVDKDKLFTAGILKKVLISGNNVMKMERQNHHDLEGHKGKLVLTFKGKEIRLRIFDDEKDAKTSESTLLNANIANHILWQMMRIINFRYDNKHDNKGTRENDSQGEAARTRKRVCLL